MTIAQFIVKCLNIRVEIGVQLIFNFVWIRPSGVLEYSRAKLVELEVIKYKQAFCIFCLNELFEFSNKFDRNSHLGGSLGIRIVVIGENVLGGVLDLKVRQVVQIDREFVAFNAC